jgi:hypothetical protein
LTEPVLSRTDLRRFSWVLAAGFAIVGAIAYYRTRHEPAHTVALVCWSIAALVLAWGLVAPATLGPLYRGWMRVGHVMGRVNMFLILGLSFFGMCTPIALVGRLRRRDLLRVDRQPAGSHWIRRGAERAAADRYRRMY